MLNYIDWYLVELKLHLEKHLVPERIQTILDESSGHLLILTQSILAERGFDEEQAMLEAIDLFGRPEMIAQDHLRQSNPRFLGLRPLWAVLAFGVLALLSWNFAWLTMRGPFDHFGETWQNGIAAFLCLLFVIMFGFACRKGRVLFLGPVALMGATLSIGLVVLFSWWIVGGSGQEQGISRFHMGRDASKLASTIAKLDGLQKYVQQGSILFRDANSAADIPSQYKSEAAAYKLLQLGNTSAYPVAYEEGGSSTEGKFLIPHRVIYPMVDGRIWALEYTADFASTKKAWREISPFSLRSIGESRTRFERLLASVGEAHGGRLFYYHPPLIWPVINQTMFLTLFLALVNFAVWGLSRRRGRLTARVLA